jgi:hypothetical protein
MLFRSALLARRLRQGQLGTESVVSTSGAKTFYTWYELYPAVSQNAGLTVKPGDIVTASLQCTAACSPSQKQTWQLVISDNTTGAAWTQNLQYQSSMASPNGSSSRLTITASCR